MIKKEGVVIASLLGGSDFLSMLSNEGGFLAPQFLDALAGYDLKTLVIIGAVLWYFRNQTDMEKKDFVCPYKEKEIDQ